ncbi:DUF1810 domain-containing protein [Ramlibacter sp. PS4R-6]|uniref:DUF1810 domain-containing protein n=1 Tax=Ramlibacter sp. PS4R-6 TaxID=3133438 RepID=UPI0030957530
MSAANDPFGLQRFVDAQDPVIDGVLRELASGRKRTHWMWFVFPQHEALGMSAMARRYGISSLAEARAYLAHPVLGARLRRCVDVVMQARGRSAHDIFGSPDDVKFKSSLTLFERAAPGEPRFAQALEEFFAGQRDARTLELIQA